MSKLTKIKETCDKLKDYYFDIKFEDDRKYFKCMIYLNRMLIAVGTGKNKQSAKNECADKAFDKLMECDSDFAQHNGVKIEYGDFTDTLKKYCQQNSFHNCQYLENLENQYKYCLAIFDDLKGEGYGVTSYKAKNMASLNLYKLLQQKYEKQINEFPIQAPQQSNDYNLKNLQQSNISINNVSSFQIQQQQSKEPIVQTLNLNNNTQQPQSQTNILLKQLQENQWQAIKDTQNTNTLFQINPLQQITQLQQFNLQNKNNEIPLTQDQKIINSNIKVEYGQQIQNQTTNQQRNINQSVQKLSENLLIDQSHYSFLDYFLEHFQSLNLEYGTLGSYNSKSIRATKPEMDMYVIIQDEFNKQTFEQFLNSIQQTFCFEIQNVYNQFILNFKLIPINFRQKVQKSTLRVNIYTPYVKTFNFFAHYYYMIKFKQSYETLRYANLSLALIHQWRDDNLKILSSEILDYLIVQITNEFNSINSPYQVLSQLIYLLKHSLLKEVAKFPSIELHPFLLSITDYHLTEIKKIDETRLNLIEQTLQNWNVNEVWIWLSKQ